jgi:hypothetical protein
MQTYVFIRWFQVVTALVFWVLALCDLTDKQPEGECSMFLLNVSNHLQHRLSAHECHGSLCEISRITYTILL